MRAIQTRWAVGNEFLTSQRARLEAELGRVEGRVAELEEAARVTGEGTEESELGPAEDLLADVSERIDDRASARSELSEQLRAYKRALDRIEQGVYEQCERCGKPIGEERLVAAPTVAHCIDCQRELEREQGER
jgi:DnaK suppressor protein